MRIISVSTESAYSEFACCPAPKIMFAEAEVEDRGEHYFICLASEAGIEAYYKCEKSIIMLMADHSFIPDGFTEIPAEQVSDEIRMKLRSAVNERIIQL